MVTPRDFSHLLGRVVGISDRALKEHFALYQKAVERLNAIENSYPLTDWSRPVEAASPQEVKSPLLDAPVASLDLEIRDPLKGIIAKILSECAAKGFTPPWKLYLGDGDFWAADRGRLVNVPWYLANPTLWRLANRQKETAYSPEQAARALRHELGHVVNYAWELWRTPLWQQTFGDFNQPYQDRFATDPRDEGMVEYLTAVSRHYPQKHPDEAWAEAFARWLDPAGDWRTEFAAWPKALEKLEAVEALVAVQVVKAEPSNSYLGRPAPYRSLKGTVRQHLGAPPGAPQFSPAGWSEHSALLKAEPAAYDAVVLHELYFDQMGAPVELEPDHQLSGAVEAAWGSWESYLLDLRAICGSTDGWALTVWDQRFSRVRNALVCGDDAGHLAGCPVVLALDCHEHAYVGDYGTRKDVYLAALFRGLDWTAVGARLAHQAASAFAGQGIGLALGPEPALMAPTLPGAAAGLPEDARRLAGRSTPHGSGEDILAQAGLTAQENTVLTAAEAMILGHRPELYDRAWAMVEELHSEAATEAFWLFLLWLYRGTPRKGAGDAHKPGLVPVLRTITLTKTGTTFQRPYWIRPEDLKPGDQKLFPEKWGTASFTPKEKQSVTGKLTAALKKIAILEGEPPPPLTLYQKNWITYKIKDAIAKGEHHKIEGLLQKLGVKSLQEAGIDPKEHEGKGAFINPKTAYAAQAAVVKALVNGKDVSPELLAKLGVTKVSDIKWAPKFGKMLGKEPGKPEEPGAEKPPADAPAEIVEAVAKANAPVTNLEELRPHYEAVRKRVLDGELHEVIKELGGDPQIAANIVASWAQSSKSKISVAARVASIKLQAEALGIDEAEMFMAEQEALKAVGVIHSSTDHEHFKDMCTQKWVDTVRACSFISQAMHLEYVDKDGFLTLYRGVGNDDGALKEHGLETGLLKTGAMIAASESEYTANTFGHGSDATNGATFALRVPLTAVRFSYRAFARNRLESGAGLYGDGSSSEYEVIIGTAGAVPFSYVRIGKPMKSYSQIVVSHDGTITSGDSHITPFTPAPPFAPVTKKAWLPNPKYY